MTVNKHTHAFCVAPMMDLTDRFCRVFHRCLSSQALLYSEMVTCNAILHGDKDYLLGFDTVESPVALQLGGSEPSDLAACARIGQQYGYSEINLNVGCPSDRVQSGRFGACLMAEPELVAQCVEAMQAAVDIPVTVKCRIGIDRSDAFEPFAEFIDTVHRAGCRLFIVHARKAWLDGLSPKENRDIPPLKYEYVQRIKQEMSQIDFVLNGELHSHEQALTLAIDCDTPLDGVMLGRQAYRNPWLLSEVDSLYYGQPNTTVTRFSVVESYLPYIEQTLATGVKLGKMTRHILGLFQGQPGGRIWRRYLSEHAWENGAGVEVVVEALRQVEAATGRSAA